MTFGKRIHLARLQMGLSVDEVAGKMGMSASTLRRYENDSLMNPKYEQVIGFARILKIPLSSLMGWDEDSMDGDIPVLCRNRSRNSQKLTQRAAILFRQMLADTDLGE